MLLEVTRFAVICHIGERVQEPWMVFLEKTGNEGGMENHARTPLEVGKNWEVS